MKILTIRITVRILATALLLFARFSHPETFGIMSGLTDGFILAAIWVCREPDQN